MKPQVLQVGPLDFAGELFGGEGVRVSDLEARLATERRRKWLLEGYVRPGVTTLLAGFPKRGKSTLVLGMCGAMMHGEPFAGLATSRASLLYLTEEPLASLKQKLDRNAITADDPIMFVQRAAMRGRSWRQIADDVLLYRPSVVVVDSLTKWLQIEGDAENNAGAMSRAMDSLQRLADAGMAVVVVAHTTVSSDRVPRLHDLSAIRGSGAIPADVDVPVLFSKSSSAAFEKRRHLHSISRFSETLQELDVEYDADSRCWRRATNAGWNRNEAKIIQALAKLDKAREVDVIDTTGLPRTTVRNWLGNLTEKGVIDIEGGGTRKSPYLYSLAEAAKREA